jgi:hypothetical protein
MLKTVREALLEERWNQFEKIQESKEAPIRCGRCFFFTYISF